MAQTKLGNLKRELKAFGSVAIAYSGGVDSAFLLKVALDALGGENVLAVTARSETYPQREFAEAKKLAKKLKARHRIIRTTELGIPNFKDNPLNRCYFCKKELFGKLKNIARQESIRVCLDATNADDLKDIRHGIRAARELGIRSPLAEAGITKKDIRAFSKKMGLPTFNKPSFACLASRFPHADRITEEGLARVDKAESFLRSLGIRQARVRHHGRIARIEVEERDIRRLADKNTRLLVVKKLKGLGFDFISLDLEGYRTGSLNEKTG
ncbi:MAG: ATP-dependent sacrificial sulfur transferase LarE [Candidatus Omnitrophota bacterium]